MTQYRQVFTKKAFWVTIKKKTLLLDLTRLTSDLEIMQELYKKVTKLNNEVSCSKANINSKCSTDLDTLLSDSKRVGFPSDREGRNRRVVHWTRSTGCSVHKGWVNRGCRLSYLEPRGHSTVFVFI